MKKLYLLTVITVMLILSGCSSIDEKMSDIIAKKSGIFENEDYKEYANLKASDQIDEENGTYRPSKEQENDMTPEKHRKIHVTFAENRYMDIQFFYDKQKTNVIDIDACYLNPGDTIYFVEPLIDNQNSSAYCFEKLVMFEIMENNRKALCESVLDEDVYSISVPKGFDGTEVSIMPLGNYANRKLSLEAYYLSRKGEKEASVGTGTWYVNGKPCNEKDIEISPVQSYIISYDFDESNYFFVESTPNYFSVDEELGVVEFWEEKSTAEVKTFEVVVRNYLMCELKLEKEAIIRINDGKECTVKKNSSWKASKLKYGDKIYVETEGKCTVLEGDYGYMSMSKEPISDGKSRFIITVNKNYDEAAAVQIDQVMEVVEEIEIYIDDSDMYGECEFYKDKERISGECLLKEGDEIKVKYKITNSDYEIISDKKGIKKFIENIFNKKERTITIIVTPDMNGERISRGTFINVHKKEEK